MANAEDPRYRAALREALWALPCFCKYCGCIVKQDREFCNSNCKYDHQDHVDAQGAREQRRVVRDDY